MFNKKTNNLFKAILSLRNTQEAEKFFRDLCTAQELKDMSERLEIARLLNSGCTYRDIASRLETSTTTVSRVANWLNNGMGGYRLVLDTVIHHTQANSVRKC